MQKSANTKYTNGNLILKQTQTHGALVLGDCNSAVDKHILIPHKIKLIISIGKQAQPPLQKLPKDIQQKSFDIHDNKSQKIITLLDQIYQIIQKGRLVGGVLVHCYAGVSRSSSFVIGYIMRKNYIDYDQAKAMVKKNRPCIYPNDGFIRQLQSYWKLLVKRQQQRLRLLEEMNKKQENQTSQQNQNISSITSKTIKGVRGAVKGAERSPSPLQKRQKEEKSIEKQVQQKHAKIKIEQKLSQSITLPDKKQAHMAEQLFDLMPCTKEKKQEDTKMSIKQRKKDVTNIYTVKTKTK